jgi:hypothetical protein
MKVHKLSDFTGDPKVIQESFNGIEEIAKTRPDEPHDMLGEKGPGWLRSILNFLKPGPGQARGRRRSSNTVGFHSRQVGAKAVKIACCTTQSRSRDGAQCPPCRTTKDHLYHL